jgi:hypothetical protein
VSNGAIGAILGFVELCSPRFNPIGRTEPDLNLIKQVQQVTALVLEGPARRFARIRSIESRKR